MQTIVDNPPQVPNVLAQIAQRSGLAVQDQDTIVGRYLPFVGEAGEIARAAEGVTVTSVDQKAEIKRSHDLRLKMRQVRLAVENTRKDLKENSLKRGQLIDTLANHVKGLIEPVERRLEDQEKIAERQEAERVAKIVKDRREALRPFCTEVVLAHLNNDGLAAMHEADFTGLLKTYKDAAAHEAEAAEREALREAEERQRRDAELAKEREEREKAQAAQRAAEEVARKEREAREAVERKAADDRRAAEEQARRQREADQRKADEEHRAFQAKAAQERAVAAEKVLQAEAVAVEALDVLGEVDRWMVASIGDLPDLDDDWEDGHSLLYNVRELLRRGGRPC